MTERNIIKNLYRPNLDTFLKIAPSPKVRKTIDYMVRINSVELDGDISYDPNLHICKYFEILNPLLSQYYKSEIKSKLRENIESLK